MCAHTVIHVEEGPPSRKVLREMYLVQERSLLDIGKLYGVSNRTVKKWLTKARIPVRTRAEAARIAKPKISAALRGRKIVFTDEWKRNLSAAGLRYGAAHARGVRVTPAGYVEHTTGPHKGRFAHTVLVEARIGRRLQSDEVVHHRDGDRENNAEENLEVMTRSALMALCRAEQMQLGVGMCKISWNQAVKIRKLSSDEKLSRSQLSERFGLSTKTIGQILRGKAWRS
ncbi:HNH endonuclease [Janthinobacterium sp. GB4P2]|uniref:HNH endonuclease n=1 Tax=Janthinobacterium sp. GB4P2 TaxID=3424189 RepID=UPI003F273950